MPPGVIGLHVVFEPNCFKYIHDAAGKVFSENSKKAILSRQWTISNVSEHYDYNAATMLRPNNSSFNFDFSFNNYIHVYYKEDDFINLESDAVNGIQSWRFTAGGTDPRATGRGGHGGGLGYGFHSQPHVCLCGVTPCPHVDFTGTPTADRVLPCTQEKNDREHATNFVGTIDEGTPLGSKGAVDDATSGNEPLWLSIAKGKAVINDTSFTAAGGAGTSGTRTIATNWTYVDIQWLIKIKTDSDCNVHYEAWSQPHGERTVLTKPKILTVKIEWLRLEERRNAPKRYIMSAATYQRLVDDVKP